MLPLQHRLAGEPLGQPWSTAAVEIPADGICAVLGKRLEGIHYIPLGLAHLLAFLIRHQPQYDNVFIGRLVEQQRGLRQQGVKPPPGLVHSLGDKLCRELLLEELLIFKRIMVLRKRHGSGVEPAVNHLRHTLHGLAAFRTGECHFVDIRPVKLHRLRLLVAGQSCKLLTAAHALHMPALTLPDI